MSAVETITLVGGPADGEQRPHLRGSDLVLVAPSPRRGYTLASDELPHVWPRVHHYERERVDGHPTLSFAYRGLR